MITLLIGENSFEVQQRLRQLETNFSGTVEKVDGVQLEVRQLPDLLMGMSLFADKRLVIVRGVAQNKAIWEVLPQWLERMSDDIHLVLVEPAPDKRTKTYKVLQKNATVEEFRPWTDRDASKAQQWVAAQAKQRGMTLSPSLCRLLVARVGVDQWQLWQSLEKLSVFSTITEDILCNSIDPNPNENVFLLFETALKGDQTRVQAMIETLRLSEEPHKLLGLLSGQAFQLAALAAASSDDDVAKDIGAHPFVLSKLRPLAARRGVRGAAQVIAAFGEADEQVKTSSGDLWLVIERALLRVAQAK